MNHFIDSGSQLVFTAAADTKGGDVVAIASGKIYGVAHEDVKAGEQGVAELKGKYELMKDAIAFSAGDTAYLGTSGTITDSTDGTYAIGVVAEDAASSGTSAIVLFDGLKNA